MLKISEPEVLDRMRLDNPWWEDGTSIEAYYNEMPRRAYFDPFFELVADRSVTRAVVLMGPRRVGKTVMVNHAIKNLLDQGVAGRAILYLSLETPLYTGLALEKLVQIFSKAFGHAKGSALHIFFDEVQYLKDWEIHLKSLVDTFTSYKFVVTGSAAAALRLKSQESGAGRFTDFILPPLTFHEYLGFIGREEELITLSGNQDKPEFNTPDIDALNAEFINYLNYGGYPEAVMSSTVRSDPGRYIKSDIIDKVLLRDLPSLYGISDIQELNRLFTMLAYNTGNEVSLDALSKESGAAKNTIKAYLEYLEAAFLIRRVHRVDDNAKRFQRAVNFKIYLTNPSMRAALFGPVQADQAIVGNLAETAVFSQWQHGGENLNNLFYARWKNGEVDIVCHPPEHKHPMWITEIKFSDRAASVNSELDNAINFAEKNLIGEFFNEIHFTSKTFSGRITYRRWEIDFMPTSLYTYMVGANLTRNKRQGHIKLGL